MEMTRERISFTSDLRDVFYLSKLASVCKSGNGLCSPRYNLQIRATAPTYLKLMTVPSLFPLPFSLCQDVTGGVCHQFGLHSTYVNVICRDFELGLLVPALPPLEHHCHRQTADW